MQKSELLNAAKAKYSRLHHAKRIDWLTGDSPLYKCGTPVNKHDAIRMIESSKSALNSEFCLNSVDISDLEYMAELDDFAKSAKVFK